MPDNESNRKRKVGMQLKSVIIINEEEITAVMFVNDADMIYKEDDAAEKVQKMLERHNRLYLAIGGYIEDKEYKYFIWI